MKLSRPRRPATSPGVAASTIPLVVYFAAMLVAGVMVMLAGTFFPWLASGAERRDVYGAAGVVQRIAELGQPIGYVMDAMPLVGLFLVLCGALWVVGLRVSAGIAVAVVTVLLALIAGAALGHRSSETVRIAVLGPMITLVGAGITALSLALLFVRGRRAAAKDRAINNSTDCTPPARSSRMELT